MKLAQIIGRKPVHISLKNPEYDTDMFKFSGQSKIICGSRDNVYEVKVWHGTIDEVTCRQCLRMIKDKEIIDDGITKFIEILTKQKGYLNAPVSVIVRRIMLDLKMDKDLYKKFYTDILDINKKLKKKTNI